MTLVIRQGLILRRIRYFAHRLISDELSGSRELCDALHNLLPPPIVKKQFEYVRTIIGVPKVIHPIAYKFEIGQIKKVFRWSPNGSDKDKPDPPESRDEKIKRMQELRQRTIDHNYDHESVWKALKERDEILGKRVEKNQSDESNQHKDDDEKK